MDNMSLVIIAVVVFVLLLVLMRNNGNEHKHTEQFVDTPAPNDESMVASGFEEEGFEVNEPFQNPEPAEEDKNKEEEPAPVPTNNDNNNSNQLPAECYPKDVLGSADLLPAGNTLHGEVVPSGQGALGDKNFLTAGYHIGINTVGQSLRNANRQLRSDPPNPQVKVSPWNQTTIEADVNRKPLEIGA